MKLKITLFILVSLGIYVFSTLNQSGYFKTIENHFVGTSQVIEGIVGTEDITIDQKTGIAFLSSEDRMSGKLGRPPQQGGIFAMNLNDSIPKPKLLTLNSLPIDFHPHGISLYNSPNGKKILFVVNHRNSGNYIEKFEYKNDSLIHLESIKKELLISPNDIVAVGENAFYFTNDHDEKLSTWRSIKDVLKVGMGNVCYYKDGKMTKTNIENILYANGINVSLEGKTLYMASTSSNKLLLYDIAKSPETPILLKEIDTHSGVDNIELDTDGNLWIGCHPQALKFLSHAADFNKISPSEIIKLTKVGEEYLQKSIYMNDGTQISASSVGAVYKKKILIGPVFQNKIVLAKMK
jgi:arylesterase / paraoxonase